MRKVSIYVLDEKKNKILVFLEKWYFKHKRKMNKEELKHMSEMLKIDQGDMEQFQNTFLKYKKLINLKEIQGYIKKDNQMPN